MQRTKNIELSTTKGASPKSSTPLKVALILVSLVAVCGLGFGIFGMIQSAQKDAEIADLESQISNESQTTNNSEAESATENPTANIPKSIRFLGDDLSFADQRYRLLYAPSGGDSGSALATRGYQYYLMDMDSLGTTNDIEKFDLVSILSPLEENEIANALPETSKNALGWITNKSQCDNFYTTYHDPVSKGDLAGGTVGIDTETEVPVEILYHCVKNSGAEEVAYSYTIYLVNAENKSARKFQYQPENRADFSR